MLRVVLGGVYGSPPPAKRKYRQYSPTILTKAYESVIDGSLSVRKASKVYNVPMQTVRDRVLGHVDPETTRSGPGPLLTQLEEARLVEHISYMAKLGYPYTRAEVINVATEFVSCLGRRDRDTSKPLSYKWFYAFLDRWPELKVQRPKTVSDLRARATSQESINNYFSELDRVLVKYNLKESPECIYNVDEKGIQQTFKPSYVVGLADRTTCVVTSEKSNTTTIIGCGNALGQQIPPYFVFKGARMRTELMEGASPGARGTVSGSGWSNGEVFQTYLETHFINYAVGKRPLLLLYDGHRSHISPSIIDWAMENDIILYVLPPHTSHILQPMDVGCFGPFSKLYSYECNKFQRETGKTVDRYSVSMIACKAYATALSAKNLQAAFKKSGIYPFSPDSINSDLVETNRLRSELQSCLAEEVGQSCTSNVEPGPNSDETIPYDDEVLVAVPLATENVNISDHSTPTCSSDVSHNDESSEIASFFKRKRPLFQPPYKNERKSITKIIAGKAITEPDTSKKVKEYLSSVSAPNKSKSTPVKKKALVFKTPVLEKQSAVVKATRSDSNLSAAAPVPSTSGQQKSGGPIDLNTPKQSEDDFSDISDVDDQEKCCMCGKFQPDELVNCPSVVFVKWAQCDLCKHWTHLIYCSNVRVIRRGDIFKCPHCE